MNVNLNARVVAAMKIYFSVCLVLLLSLSLANEQSPYAGEERRSIKSLSAGEIESLRSGDGMGFARLAELNAYPGPKHALELAFELGLTPTQLAETETLFGAMRSRAIALGEALIEAESDLDRDFENGAVDAESLKHALLDIGRIRAELRFVHLEAHLRQKLLLTDTQIEKYVELRGYRAGPGHHVDHSGHRPND